MPNTMRILLVEDNENEITSYKESLEVYKEEKEYNIELIICKNTTEASAKIDNNIDAAIVDLRLGEGDKDGNSVIQLIQERLHRLPVAIYSGTPDDVEPGLITPLIKKYTKGDDKIGFVDIVDELHIFFKTGVTKIFGGRGVLENAMSQVFHTSILPQIEAWKKYVDDGKDIEKPLIRFTINHLLQLLDHDTDNCLPEEMYILPHDEGSLATGSILKCDGTFFIIISPPCDMVVHGTDGRNTSKIAICELDDHDSAISASIGNQTSPATRVKTIENRIRNKKQFQHWLPKGNNFTGGFVNFRHVSTFSEEELRENFIIQNLVVAPTFMKDIISRFSAYYARQGQPDFIFREIAHKIEPDY